MFYTPKVLQRLLEVLAVEERGVLEPRPQHRLVAGRHHRGVDGAVGHRDEVRQQRLAWKRGAGGRSRSLRTECVKHKCGVSMTEEREEEGRTVQGREVEYPSQ